MTITLPPEIEGALSEQAKIQGKTPESIAVETLRKALLTSGRSHERTAERSLFDRLAPYVGAVQGTGESCSENCGEHFTDYLLEKKRRGHL